MVTDPLNKLLLDSGGKASIELGRKGDGFGKIVFESSA